eukprot:1100693-Amphidinium_carterae.2
MAKSRFCNTHKKVADCLYREADRKRKKHGDQDGDWLAYQKVLSKAIPDFFIASLTEKRSVGRSVALCSYRTDGQT